MPTSSITYVSVASNAWLFRDSWATVWFASIFNRRELFLPEQNQVKAQPEKMFGYLMQTYRSLPTYLRIDLGWNRPAQQAAEGGIVPAIRAAFGSRGRGAKPYDEWHVETPIADILARDPQ